MFNVYSTENQNFYLNNSLISGVQNLSISYNNNIQPSLSIEDSSHNYYVSQPIIANIDLDYLLSSDDKFISYTGSSSFSGKVEYGNKYFTFSSGYLTNYSVNYRIGEYPQVNVRCIILGELGNASGNFIYAPKILDNFTIGDQCYVDFNLNELNLNRLQSFSTNIEVPREAVYTIGNYLPDDVIIKYPINININMEFSMSDYTQEKVTNLFAGIVGRNTILSFKKHQSLDNILSLNFNNLINSQTQLNYSLNDEAKLRLDFNTYILSGI